MQTITRKYDIKRYLAHCLTTYQTAGVSACVQAVQTKILSKKVKFPLLEFCGHRFHEEIETSEQLPFCDQIEALKTIGGNVLLGIILQDRLTTHFDQSLHKATEYIAQAEGWYVCDIIGERVFGYALRHQPAQTIPEIERLSTHPSYWVVRSLGAGAHYAIKKGLDKAAVKQVFQILLSMAHNNHKEIRQGVGWAAKTTAKFHPDIIAAYQTEIENKNKVANWFRSKIKIGLNRNAYNASQKGKK